MHITSLPSPYGIGTMGKEAIEFIDFLCKAGQKNWQILPICPTSYGDSPYQSFSTYAGNPYLIDLDLLAEEGLLFKEEFQNIKWFEDETKVDFEIQYNNKFKVLKFATDRLYQKNSEMVQDFCDNNEAWLEEYSLFMALKEVNNGNSWQDWDYDIKFRKEEKIQEMKDKLQEEMKFYKAIQFLFFKQWYNLKGYANRNGISIIGDLPIYVALDSVDVWSNPSEFYLDSKLKPVEVAGCPPDGFSADGQLWGNPLFRWDVMKNNEYSWWVNRIKFQCETYDILRIDHFRGFDEYYAIPFGDETAKNGSWKKGVGIELFNCIEKTIGKQNIIAEDLGFLTETVIELLKATGFPGMKVLQFAFDSRDSDSQIDTFSNLPYAFPKNSVAYVGTHDNDTIIGWVNDEAIKEDVNIAKDYFYLNEDEGYNFGMMRGLWSCNSDTAIVQMQDILNLGTQARMNTPSTVGENWKWRAIKNSYNDNMAEKIYNKMKLYKRL